MKHEEIQVADLRKQSHLELAFNAQNACVDSRFYYEPMMAAHPLAGQEWLVNFAGKTMRFPIWISSMTGGTSQAGPINKLLAQTARKFGFGMGLGSCRIILDDNTFFEDFNLRPILGDELPFFANIGIAQLEEIFESNSTYLLKRLVEKLDVDGLIIHVNPLQEWLQPEGDRIQHPPIQTITRLLNELDIRIIVKEVGQGFGKESMKALLQMPLEAIDFAANGGTNFSKLELLRNQSLQAHFEPLVGVGHSAQEMVQLLNDAVDELGNKRQCNQVIISGGISTFLDGYELISKAKIPAIYGQAAPFLKYANESQSALDTFAQHQVEGLLFAKTFLRVK
jgi:isopentenyl-diphosphate delta-isomerase